MEYCPKCARVCGNCVWVLCGCLCFWEGAKLAGHCDWDVSSTAVVQSDGSGHKWAPKALRFASGWDDPVAERAAHLPQLVVKRVRGAIQDGFDLVLHPPLCCCLQAVQLQSWPSLPVCWVCAVLWLLQTGKRSEGACCTHWRNTYDRLMKYSAVLKSFPILFYLWPLTEKHCLFGAPSQTLAIPSNCDFISKLLTWFHLNNCLRLKS